MKEKELCFGESGKPYRCETGYCCGESECCAHYYELWWFWLVWTLLILLSCCCAYSHRRVKLRMRMQQRQREISIMAYQGTASTFPAQLPPALAGAWAGFKLPAYDEVTIYPQTPPPPYSERALEEPRDPLLPRDGVVPTGEVHFVPETSLPTQEENPRLLGLDCPLPRTQTGGCSPMGAACSPRIFQWSTNAQGEQSQEGSPLRTIIHTDWHGREATGTDDSDEELRFPRQRHITGDSGIEVCVEEEEEEEAGIGRTPRDQDSAGNPKPAWVRRQRARHQADVLSRANNDPSEEAGTISEPS